MGIAVLVIGSVDAARPDPALGVRFTVAFQLQARANGIPEHRPGVEAHRWTTLRKTV
jgi:hypothetical protein